MNTGDIDGAQKKRRSLFVCVPRDSKDLFNIGHKSRLHKDQDPLNPHYTIRDEKNSLVEIGEV